MATLGKIEAKAFEDLRDEIANAKSKWEVEEILSNDPGIVGTVAEFIVGKNPADFNDASVVDDIRELQYPKEMDQKVILEKMDRVIKEVIKKSGGRRRRGKKTRKTRKSRRYTRRR